MTKVPTHIIGFNEDDLAKAKQSFLVWSAGHTMNVKFMTLEESRGVIEIPPYTYGMHDEIQLTQSASLAYMSSYSYIVEIASKINHHLYKEGKSEEEVKDFWSKLEEDVCQ